MENDKISKIFDNRITLITCVTNNPTKRLGVLQVINGKIYIKFIKDVIILIKEGGRY